jgi:hypothetical protein
MTAIIEATPVVRPAMTPLPKGESCVLILWGIARSNAAQADAGALQPGLQRVHSSTV